MPLYVWKPVAAAGKEIKKTDVMNGEDLGLVEKRAVLSHHEWNFDQHTRASIQMCSATTMCIPLYF